MRKKTRSILIIIISAITIAALTIIDITSNGKLTTGFLGMLILLLGSLIIPTIIELVKENKKHKI